MRHIFVLLAGLGIAGCAHLPDAAQIEPQLRQRNADRLTLAVNRELTARGAKQVSAELVRITINTGPADLAQCEGKSSLIMLSGAAISESVEVPACGLLTAMSDSIGLYTVRLKSGATLQLLAASATDRHATAGSGDGYVLAENASGSRILLKPVAAQVKRVAARVEGHCDNMPNPGAWEGAARSFFVVPDSTAPLEAVDVPYLRETLDAKCDSTTS
jgi:hypothetical protein